MSTVMAAREYCAALTKRPRRRCRGRTRRGNTVSPAWRAQALNGTFQWTQRTQRTRSTQVNSEGEGEGQGQGQGQGEGESAAILPPLTTEATEGTEGTEQSHLECCMTLGRRTSPTSMTWVAVVAVAEQPTWLAVRAVGTVPKRPSLKLAPETTTPTPKSTW